MPDSLEQRAAALVRHLYEAHPSAVVMMPSKLSLVTDALRAERAAALEDVRLSLREEVAKLKDQLAEATCPHCGKYVFADILKPKEQPHG